MENNLNSIKGNNPIVVAMSGGVDSSVAAALMNKDYEDVIGITLRPVSYTHLTLPTIYSV